MCARKRISDKMAGDEAGGMTLKHGRLKGEKRHEVATDLVILLHYDLPVKHPSPLPQHVEVELRKHWGTKTNRQKQLHLHRCERLEATS